MVYIKSGILPIGNLSYEQLQPAVNLVAKKFQDIPFLAVLPKLFPGESILQRTVDNMPGFSTEQETAYLDINLQRYKTELINLNKAYVDSSSENLEKYAINSGFLEKFLQIIQKFKSQNACVNLTGPFSLSQIVSKNQKEQLLLYKDCYKLFIQTISVKAIWAIKKMKEYNPNIQPVIILEEPLLGQFGTVRQITPEITYDFVTKLMATVIKKIKSEGGIVCVHSSEKCDWSIPINANVDIISYDAYNNPNNLTIMPEIINKFLDNGGLINWGIIPTLSENLVRGLTAEYIYKRLQTTIDGVVLSGVPISKIINSMLISLNGNTNHLSVFFAEKAILLLPHVLSRIKAKSHKKKTASK